MDEKKEKEEATVVRVEIDSAFTDMSREAVRKLKKEAVKRRRAKAEKEKRDS